jgi:hypothetical protein
MLGNPHVVGGAEIATLAVAEVVESVNVPAPVADPVVKLNVACVSLMTVTAPSKVPATPRNENVGAPEFHVVPPPVAVTVAVVLVTKFVGDTDKVCANDVYVLTDGSVRPPLLVHVIVTVPTAVGVQLKFCGAEELDHVCVIASAPESPPPDGVPVMVPLYVPLGATAKLPLNL